MNERLRLLRPTALTFILLLLVLLTQVVFFSSTTTSYSLANNEPAPTIHSFGLGSPIQVSTTENQISYDVRWGVLLLNLAVCYLVATSVSTGMTKAARLRRPATAYGMVAIAIVAVAFLIAIVISKVYWGYFLSRPALLPEVQQVIEVRAVVPFKISSRSGERVAEVDDTYSLSDSMASGKKYPEDCLDTRILLELERRNLLPKTLTQTLSNLPDLYPLIQSSGFLAKSSSGYDSSARLRGVAVDALGNDGNRLVILGMTGGQLSNDHYPYYELLFVAQPSHSRLKLVQGRRFFYDAAGMEGFEWYVIWPILAILGVLFGFAIFTIFRFIRTWKYNQAL